MNSDLGVRKNCCPLQHLFPKYSGQWKQKLQIGSIPRVTKNFNKAKKDTEKVLRDLIREIDSALNQVNEIKKLREGDSN